LGVAETLAREKRLTIAEYVALGDAERALNPIQNSVRLAADRAITGLRPAPTDAEMVALRDAFVPHLVRVRLDDGKRVRQPARITELPQDARRLIGALVEARLLTTRDGLVEVAHEALFKAWPTLDQWLTEEQAFLTDLERIRDAHDIWAQALGGRGHDRLWHDSDMPVAFATACQRARSGSRLASVLPEGRTSANTHIRSGAVWGIPV
jgi:hypothetical protein